MQRAEHDARELGEGLTEWLRYCSGAVDPGTELSADGRAAATVVGLTLNMLRVACEALGVKRY